MADARKRKGAGRPADRRPTAGDRAGTPAGTPSPAGSASGSTARKATGARHATGKGAKKPNAGGNATRKTGAGSRTTKGTATSSKRERAGEPAAGVGAPEPERRVPEHPPAFPSASQLEQASVGGTAVFTVAAALAAALPETFIGVGVGVSLALFAVGCVAFLGGFARAVPRSRSDDIALGGLFFLSGSAPKRVQRTFLICLGVQIVVGITAASFRPFTPVAFATLVPVYALGLATMWGATFGAFPPRVVTNRR